jgi:hypothetical protein
MWGANTAGGWNGELLKLRFLPAKLEQSLSKAFQTAPRRLDPRHYQGLHVLSWHGNIRQHKAVYIYILYIYILTCDNHIQYPRLRRQGSNNSNSGRTGTEASKRLQSSFCLLAQSLENTEKLWRVNTSGCRTHSKLTVLRLGGAGGVGERCRCCHYVTWSCADLRNCSTFSMTCMSVINWPEAIPKFANEGRTCNNQQVQSLDLSFTWCISGRSLPSTYPLEYEAGAVMTFAFRDVLRHLGTLLYMYMICLIYIY